MLDRMIKMQGGSIPHMIFSGPKGCGKVTFAKLFAENRLENPSESLKVVTAETKITKKEKDILKKTSYINIEGVINLASHFANKESEAGI